MEKKPRGSYYSEEFLCLFETYGSFINALQKL